MQISNSAVNDRSVFLENIFRPVQTHSMQLFSFLFIVLFMQRVFKLPPLFQIFQLPAKASGKLTKRKICLRMLNVRRLLKHECNNLRQ